MMFKAGVIPDVLDIEPGTGFALNDTAQIITYRSGLIKVQKNDVGGKDKDYKVVAVNGQEISPETEIFVDNARIYMTRKGTLSVTPEKGWQMQPVWLPSPETVWSRLVKVGSEGYKNFTLWEHLRLVSYSSRCRVFSWSYYWNSIRLCNGLIGMV